MESRGRRGALWIEVATADGRRSGRYWMAAAVATAGTLAFGAAAVRCFLAWELRTVCGEDVSRAFDSQRSVAT